MFSFPLTISESKVWGSLGRTANISKFKPILWLVLMKENEGVFLKIHQNHVIVTARKGNVSFWKTANSFILDPFQP